MNIIQGVSNNTLIYGDLNFNMLCNTNELQHLCELYDLKNLVEGPTCFKGDSPTSIDVILVSNPRRFKRSINVSCGLSDFHNFTAVASRINMAPRNPRLVNYRCYRDFKE